MDQVTTEEERPRKTATERPVLDSQAPRPKKGSRHQNGKEDEKR